MPVAMATAVSTRVTSGVSTCVTAPVPSPMARSGACVANVVARSGACVANVVARSGACVANVVSQATSMPAKNATRMRYVAVVTVCDANRVAEAMTADVMRCVTIDRGVTQPKIVVVVPAERERRPADAPRTIVVRWITLRIVAGENRIGG